ncbi:MAG TPA: DNA methyltransferase [Candidatus Brocadiaceae bacterium]
MLGLIYRLLFIMVIEERDLIYDPAAEDKLMRKKEIYNHYYSLARLRRLSGNSSILNERFQDIWISLRNTFRLFEDGNKGKFLEIKPLNGDLFSVNGLGMLEQSELSNKILFEALNTLSWFKTPQGQILPVNYKLLNVEEFGSVYEGLLEYDPVVIKQSGQWSFKLVGGEGRARSGSHYTPEELVQPLIKHSLDYLLQDREALIKKEIEQTGLKGESKRNERESVIQKHLLSLKICDVACGSGHILLSAARRVADRYSSWLEESDQPTPSGVRHAIRHVVRNCIYGVDKNPLAVELCKVALWLEAHNPGEPLSFLDHHIKNGDSIVGLAYRDELENGIPDEAFRTLLGDEKEIASTLLKKNREERKIRLDKKAGVQLTTETIESGVQEFMAEYDAFSRLPENNPKEIDLKAKAYKKFIDGKGFTFLKAMADTQVAQFFISKTETTKENLMTDADFRRILSGYKGLQDRKVTKATVISFEKRFFHWFIEFPEVFQQSGSSLSEKPGFNCILGNPPFLGGLKISTNYGNHYLSYLHYKYSNAKGTCDIVAYFFRRIFSILSLKGFMSLISTNTISQGDTRTGGIENILSEGGGINYAIKSIKWPGVAAVDVSLISIFKGKYNNLNKLLNGKQVNDINSFLDNSSGIQTAQILKTNESKSFIGSNILGEGFILENTDAKSILSNSQNYKNVIFPYLSGDDLNNEPNQIAKRFVINFHNYPLRRFNDDEWNDLIDVDKMEIKQMILVNSFIYYAPPDYEKEVASDFPICIEIIKNKVKPEREKLKDKNPKERWWLYERQRKELYDTINNNGSAFAISRVTKYCIFSKVSLENVYSNATVIFSLKDPLTLFLNSSLHDIWCWKYGSTMGTGTLRYTPSDCFETFAFPPKLSLNQVKKLTHIYEQYYAYRKKLMLKIKLGLTKTYNVFHAKEIQAGIITTTLLNLDKKAIEKQFQKEVWNLWNHLQKTTGTCILEEAIAGIVKLRELHVQMDNAVLEAYDWPDIQLKHDFYEVDYLPENDRIRFTIYPEARKEILKRLLELNHKIFEEEALQGLHKEEIVKKFYEQKGQPVPEEVSKWFGKGKPKPYKKSKSSQQSNEPGEGYGDLFNQNR